MKKSKIFILLALVFSIMLMAVACSSEESSENGGSNGGGGNPATTYSVQLVVNDQTAVELVDGNRKTVEEGQDVIFNIKINDGFIFDSVSHGVYDKDAETLTVTDVTTDLRINFKVKALSYDPNKSIDVNIVGTAADESNVGMGWQNVKYGTEIHLNAGDKSRPFAAWTIGNTLANGGTVLSEDREFTYSVIPENIGNTLFLAIYSNYLDNNVLYYDLNGGAVNTESTNMKGNAYYTATHDKGIVTVTLSETYLDFAESASTFWDDGSFYRDGYVLIEYNTEPDGSGEAYSLGSKFYAPSTKDLTLYCIWAEATAASDFETESVRWGYASDVNATKAPHWKIDGLKITKYNGDAETVVIPEMIGGQYVTTIDAGAFTGKNVKTLVISKYVIRIEDGAFVGCSNLETLYMSDGIFYMNDAAFDAATYTNFKHFYLNAVMAPRFMKNGHGDGGVFSVKLSRILASQDKNRIIVVSGSSTYQGLSSDYLEGLFDGDYTVINLGTTRTGTGMIFFEAMQHYVHEGDIVIFAPENHINMFGENTMWYRSFYDLEGMYNLYRYIDISKYPGVLGAFSAYNKERRFTRNPTAYEDIAGSGIRSNKYGDFQQASRQVYCGEQGGAKYIDSYFITLNRYYKNDLKWDDVAYQTANKDYNDPNNTTWSDITLYKDEVNRAIALVKATGAGVYFGFAPADGDDVVPEAQNVAWLDAYDKLIEDTYDFDGLVGSCKNYIFAHKYFFDCAYHVNDYGRTYRTYQLYVDLCEILGIEEVKGITDAGTDYQGVLFETGSDGTPVTKVEYLTEQE